MSDPLELINFHPKTCILSEVVNGDKKDMKDMRCEGLMYVQIKKGELCNVETDVLILEGKAELGKSQIVLPNATVDAGLYYVGMGSSVLIIRDSSLMNLLMRYNSWSSVEVYDSQISGGRIGYASVKAVGASFHDVIISLSRLWMKDVHLYGPVVFWTGSLSRAQVLDAKVHVDTVGGKAAIGASGKIVFTDVELIRADDGLARHPNLSLINLTRTCSLTILLEGVDLTHVSLVLDQSDECAGKRGSVRMTLKRINGPPTLLFNGDYYKSLYVVYYGIDCDEWKSMQKSQARTRFYCRCPYHLLESGKATEDVPSDALKGADAIHTGSSHQESTDPSLKTPPPSSMGSVGVVMVVTGVVVAALGAAICIIFTSRRKDLFAQSDALLEPMDGSTSSYTALANAQ